MLRPSSLRRLIPPGLRAPARRALVHHRYRGLTASDALLVSYPKSGSTWLRFLLAHLLSGNEADYGSIRGVVPPLGQHRSAQAALPDAGRLVRSHEPLAMDAELPALPVLYLLRDPRDVCLSYFNHRRRQGYDGDAPTFVRAFLAGEVDGYGPWSDHLAAALRFQASDHGPFLLLRYEDLRAEPVATLTAIQRFLSVDADPRRIDEVLAANTRDRMRAKEDAAFLHRVGMDGAALPAETRSWRELVPAELDSIFLAGCGAAMERCGYSTLPRQRSDADGDG